MKPARPKGRILVLDDDELIGSMLGRALRQEGYELRVEHDPGAALEAARSFVPDVALLDVNLPGKSGLELLQEMRDEGITAQAIMLTADDSAETAVRAMKLGAADYLTKPFDLDEVKIVVANVLEKRALKDQVDSLRRMSAEIVERPIIGVSPVIESLKEEVSRLAEAGVNTILITGESGTGKEMFARFAHAAMFGEGADSYAPFVGINCAAMPENLVESELFGHERGAFTDAKSEKKGLFELAHGGSILLDEIGDMPLFLQSKLLRVLEERQARRIGGRQDIPIEVVVFATTNRDLEQAVENGTFRPDLFYRLNAFPLHLPPLRERRADILALARYFLGRFLVKYKRPGPTDFSPEAEARLSAYDWPGNVREVRNVVERIVVLGRGQKVLPEHLPREIAGASAAPAVAPGAAKGFELSLPDEGLSLEDVERQLIEQALAKAGGNKTVAAKLLGMTYDSLRYQIKKFALE
ncbi:MAG: sigma-54 dependent transcriptional regulator [Acidobacteria bacterium]|nr:sigma-54 dependent transcriptional regulator [Acidobacteriota bacterium]